MRRWPTVIYGVLLAAALLMVAGGLAMLLDFYRRAVMPPTT